MDIEMIDLIYELANEIKDNEIFKKYKLLEKILENKYKVELNKLKLIKENLNILYRHSNEYKEKMQELIEIKNLLYKDKDFVDFKDYERKLDDLLGKINKEIAATISENINYSNELGLIL